jgi:hypothetical protein
MYADLAPWWGGQWGLSQLLTRVSFSELAVVPAPLDLVLPAKYIAVKFYARPTFVQDEQMQAWVEQVVDKFLTKHPDVSIVDLASGIDADDHSDFHLGTHERITGIRHVCTPQNNLAVQAAVIARSSGFVGTYGGTQQLAIRLKKPALGFYQKFEGTCVAHKILSEYLGMVQNTPVFIGQPTSADFVAQVLG